MVNFSPKNKLIYVKSLRKNYNNFRVDYLLFNINFILKFTLTFKEETRNMEIHLTVLMTNKSLADVGSSKPSLLITHQLNFSGSSSYFLRKCVDTW